MNTNAPTQTHTSLSARWTSSIRAFCVFLLCLLGLSFQAVAPTYAVAPAIPVLPQVAGSISGRVFRDLNFNGQPDSNEPGLAGITLGAYDAANTLVASTQTITDGLYLLTSPTLAAPLRLELTGQPAGFFASRFQPLSNDSGSLTRFITQLGAGYNFALINPTDYCHVNPRIATNCFVFGNALTGPYKHLSAITAFPYNAGTPSLSNNFGVRDPITRTTNISNSLVGSTWGLAYQRDTNTLFAAAFTKRHAGFGPGGTGAIYQINPISNTASLLVNLNTLFPNSTGADPHNQNDFFLDNPVWDRVGKSSLGGIDLSDDGETLWVMNLNDRKLYRLPIGIPASAPAASAVQTYAPPDIGIGPTGCVLHPQTPVGERNLNLRPFGVKVVGGNVFLGWVCTAESSQLRQDLRAFVYKLEAATGSYTQIANFALNYPRGCASGYNECNSALWNPWSPTERANLFYPFQEYDYAQPMLADIEFDDAGNMLVSLGDRFGHQSGEEREELNGPLSIEGAPAGDILKLFPTNTAGTNYQLENNARLGSGPPTLGQDNGQGPGGGEFYFRDTFPISIFNFGLHQELATGGLTVLPTSGEVVLSAYNPPPLYEDVNGQSTFRTVGPLWFNNSTGNRTRSHMLIQYIEPGYFTKATGMGDVEIMCDSAPIEIGNRVWLDIDGNGIQDPDENAVPGITVRLYPFSGAQMLPTPIATTTTDAQGRYHFNSAGPDNTPFTADDLGNYGPDGLANTADDLGLPGLKPSTSRITNRYAIRLDNPANYFTGEVLDNFAPTAPDVNSGPNADERDSDAVRVNGFAQITFITGHSGQNNYALDFGFSQPAKLSGRVWVDGDHNGVRSQSDAVITGSRVTAAGPGSFVITAFTDGNGEYAFNYAPPGVYTVNFGVPQGYTFTFPLIGNAAFDNDVVQPNGSTYTFTLSSSDDKRNVDAGFWKPGPAIDLQALTNGADANTLTGPIVNYASPITFTYRVTNTGDITLARILVQDDPLGTIDCPDFELAPGQGMVCERGGLAAGGQYTNVASVVATDFVSVSLITDTDLSHHFGLVTPTVQIKKYTNGQSADAPPGLALVTGTPVTWTYVVTNAGNVPFTAIAIVDTPEGSITCPNYALAVGQSVTCARNGIVRSGAYANTVIVTATYNVPNVKGTTTANALSYYTGYAPGTVGGLVWVDRNLNGHYEPNELPLFGVTATLLSLSGNTTVTMGTTRSGGDGSYSFKNLLPGSYAVVFTPLPGYGFTLQGQGDVTRNSDADPTTGRTPTFVLAAGEVNNTIGAGLFTELPRLSVRVTVNGLDSDVAPGPLFEAGGALEWTYVIQNTGEVTLTTIRVGDDKTGPLASCNRDILPPGQTFICNQLGSVALGQFANTATVTGTIGSSAPGEGGPTVPGAVVTTSATSYFVGGLANLSVQKNANPITNSLILSGNLITYSLTVFNVGTFTATGVVVSDVLPGGLAFVSGSPGVAAITDTTSVTVSWVVGGLGLNQNRTVTLVTQAVGTPRSGQTFVNIGYAASNQTRQTLSNRVEHQFTYTAVSLMRFAATLQSNRLVLEWRTSAEVNTFGFALYRSTTAQRAQAVLLGELVPATGAGANYRYVDAEGSADHYYWLVEVDRGGSSTEYGPVRAQAALAVANVVAGGVAVPSFVIAPSSVSSAAAAEARAASPVAQLAQQAVGVQAAPAQANAEMVAVEQPIVSPVLPRVESALVAVQPEEPQRDPIPAAPAAIDAPQAAPIQRSNPPAIQQPASAVGQSQSTRAVVQPAPMTRVQPPQTQSPIVNWWGVLAGALLVLMAAAGSILGLLLRQLRRR